jgi:predicted HTH transcriptional regulator
MPEWTFLTNHALVLSLIARQPYTTALELANTVGITERAIRKIIADLLVSWLHH